jgi:glycolate oxidase FAD binding subunit
VIGSDEIRRDGCADDPGARAHDGLVRRDALTASRPGGPEDAVDGVIPTSVCEPVDGAALAAALAGAAKDRVPTVVRGGGTKQAWGRVPVEVGLVISTARLTSPIVHRDGDLTVTAGAGVRLAALNQQLATKGQWLPVDSAFDRTTIGGLIATNDAGPMRHRYGTPRDLLIGVTLALTDGRTVKAGGTVVKNVAGYDLGRFISGSFGTLAVIVDATFKLLPVPRASTTLVCRYRGADRTARDAAAADRAAADRTAADRLAADVATVAASQLEPLACEVRADGAGDLTLLLRFASSPESTETQAASAQALLSGEVSVLTGDAEAALWATHVRAPWQGGGEAGRPAVVRLSWLPSRLSAVLALVSEISRPGIAFPVAARSTTELPGTVTLAGRGIVGTGLLTIAGSARDQILVIERLRRQVDTVGHVVILRADREVKQEVDVWGSLGGAAASLAALKRSFDPAGILNAARGPV